MSSPVIASEEPPPDGDVEEVSVAGVEPVPPVDEGFVVGLLELPPVELPPVVPERVAPAAGLAVRISGTTQAAAPAVAENARPPERLTPRECPSRSGITGCNRRCPHLSICPLLPHFARPSFVACGRLYSRSPT